MYWHTYLSIALLVFSATCFVLAWVKEGKIKVYSFFYRDSLGRLIVLDARLWRLNFDVIHYRSYNTKRFFSYFVSKSFGYKQVSAGRLALRWKVDAK
ncbi:hypothetical protein PQD73_gp017 [Stenotrophomonas phage Salva]|uniref:Uncharacterized protein n=1 Tax=Stenotrophomonas phage Salva TaxID=2801524 RepID=A0A7U3WJU8_9CAUD|nr:hypothetical protein PQD73_gp017 [Stenotrophomonas phage Salva]QQM18181.1 hypothetical protein CPT_Salva_017 [Stenotrophomonas phage Salva]